MHAKRVGHHGLDHVAVRAGHPQRVALVQFGQPAVMLTDRRHGTRLHVGQPFTTGEDGGARLLLHHRPEGIFDQVADLAARPAAVVDLGDALVDHRIQPERGGQRVDRAPAAQQRRAHDRPDRQPGEPRDDGLRLLTTLVVEVDALAAAGQRVRGVRRRPAVPQQYHGHVADTVTSCRPDAGPRPRSR